MLTNNAVSPNTKVDMSQGAGNNLVGPMTKDLSAAWASGNGNGGLVGGGSVAANTVYHCFAFPFGSGCDFGFSTSLTPTNPEGGGVTPIRLGSVFTDGSSHIVAFHQYGEEFYFDTSVKDVDVTNPGTSAVTRTLTVPTGVKVKAFFTAISWDANGDTEHYCSCLDATDEAVSFTNAVESAGSDKTVEANSQNSIWTNTSAQVRTRLSASTAATEFKIRTRGWIDPNISI